MKLRELLEEWGMTSLKINLGILQSEWKPNDYDKIASWEMYIELLTRITTQPLPESNGDEATALASIHSLFATTRNILKEHGRYGQEFTKLAIIVLNQIIRPFTTKWHSLSYQGVFDEFEQCNIFRDELQTLQVELQKYSRLLASIAGVEDLTGIEIQEG